ncbi:MAG: porin family protein [Chitinophagaceae bacterium]
MENVFRKAAADYPLKTDGGDWDAVMQRLQQPNDVPPAGNKSGKDRSGTGWFWLLLLPLAFVAHIPPFRAGNGQGTATTKQNITAIPVATTVQQQVSQQVVSRQEKPGTDNTVDNSTNKYQPVKKVTLPQYSQATSGKLLTYHTYSNNNTGISLRVSRNQVTKNTDQLAQTERLQITEQDNIAMKDEGGTVLTGETNITEKPTAQKATGDSTVSKEISEEKKDSVVNNPVPAETKDKKEPVKKEKGFYAGIVISPDLSTVKMQQVRKLGYSAGVLIGYRLSKRWAIETGALWEKKYYYSDGEYFKTDKIPLPSGTTVNNVNGWCNMIDIPVTARYFFSIKQHHTWSANAGLLSYIMNKESYTYNYTRYGNVYERGWDYKSSTRNWFSVAQLGIGYEYNIGRWGNLRVEPYVRIPLGGIGIGSLPVSSAGLNIGIMKSIR